MALSAVFYAI